MHELTVLWKDKKKRLNLIVLACLSLLLPILLLVVEQTQVFAPKALQSLISLGDGGCVTQTTGGKAVNCSSVPLILTNPFPNTSSNGSSPSPSSRATTSPSPVNSPSTSVSPSPAASVSSANCATSISNGTELQVAIGCYKNATGTNRKITLPAGTIEVDKKISVPHDLTIVGAGINQTIIKMSANFAKKSTPESDGDDALMANDSSAGQQNIILKDFTLQGDGVRSGNSCCYGLKLQNITNAFVINVGSSNFGIDGIFLGQRPNKPGADKVRITGCVVSNNGRNGIALSDVTNSVIDGCTISGNSTQELVSGIDLEPDNGQTDSNNHIFGNSVTGNHNNGIQILQNPNDPGGVVSNNFVCNNSFGGNAGTDFDDRGSGTQTSGCTAGSLNLPTTSLSIWKPLSYLFSLLPFKIPEAYALGLAPALANSPYKELLASYWKFDEADGNSAADTNFQSNSGPGTAVNTTIVDGKFGKARMIPSGGYVSIPNIGEYRDNVMTIAGWIKPASFPAGASFWNQPEGTSLEFAPEGDGTMQCFIKPIRENQESTFSIKSTGTDKLTLNTWNHIACTYDKATLKLYINGRLVASGDKIGWLNQPLLANPVMIGKNIASGQSINSAVDDIAYWNRALTDAEIASIYNNGQGTAIDLSPASTNTASPTPASSSITTPSPTGFSSQTSLSVQYRLAENTDLLKNAEFHSLNLDPFLTTFPLASSDIGPKQIWVEFKDQNGNSKIDHITFNLVDKPAAITGVDCTLDLAGGNIKANIKGSRFGAAQGQGGIILGYNLTVDDLKNGKKADIDVLDWKNDSLGILFKQGTLTANLDQKLNLSVLRDDGTTSNITPCVINTSLLSLGTKVICREDGKFDQSNVKVSIFYTLDNKLKQVDETATINKEGLLTGLKTKLQEGKDYVVSIKAPNSLRRNASFTASKGTSVINDPDGNPFILPIGDISPTASPDGEINSADRAELVKQWRTSASTTTNTSLTGDLNKDSRVNSLDWACMRYDYGSSDDPEQDLSVNSTAAPAPSRIYSIPSE